MNLPKDGRIIIIDDEFEKEAKPLIDVLSQECISFLYFSGKKTELPKEPLEGIRIVFLDLELLGIKGSSSKTKASNAVSVLKKLISTKNGPYGIIFWSMHSEENGIIDQVIENCKHYTIEPNFHIDLDKPSCKKDNKFNFDVINQNITKKINSIGAFQFYIQWENIVNKAMINFVSEFSCHLSNVSNWSKTTSRLFYKLYKSYVGKNELEDKNEQFKCASQILNSSFFNRLVELTNSQITLPENIILQEGSIDKTSIAKINTSLFLEKSFLQQPVPGNIYLKTNKKLLESLKTFLFKESKAPDSCKLCFTLLTPECDIAQNKTLSVELNDKKKSKVHRIVYGLLFESSEKLSDILHDRGKDARFQLFPIWYNKKIHCILIHFGTISLCSENEITRKPIFTIKRELFFDLQSKAANHVNRLGNYQLQ